MKEKLLAAFGEGNLPETNYQRQWWNASKDNKIYHHLDVSLSYIDKLFQSEGPFDGIFGFSVCGFILDNFFLLDVHNYILVFVFSKELRYVVSCVDYNRSVIFLSTLLY